jgi:hypothetical protein
LAERVKDPEFTSMTVSASVGFDDHVAAGGQVHPRLKGVADGGIHPDDAPGFPVASLWMLHRQIGLVSPKEGLHPGHGLGAIHHHPHHLGAVQVAQHPVDESLRRGSAAPAGWRFQPPV